MIDLFPVCHMVLATVSFNPKNDCEETRLLSKQLAKILILVVE